MQSTICPRWHCKYDHCDECQLDRGICNGGDGDKPGLYCRHMSSELAELIACTVCGVVQCTQSHTESR